MQRNATVRSNTRHPPTSPYARGQNAVANPFQLPTQLKKNNNNNEPKRNANGKTPFMTPVSPYQVNLEEQICSMFQDITQSPIILCIGQKGGGKSFRIMTMLMWLLRNNVFDQYFLVLPTFHYEASNSYAWLKPFEDKVFITTEYTPEMSQAFLARRDETIPPHEIPRTFLWMDDVGMNEAFRCDRSFVGLLSIARHKRLCVCLCYHSLTSGHTLSPFLRQNVTHTLLFRVTNEKLLESIYEELVSMTGHFERFRDFKQVYNQHTCSQINPATGEVQKNFAGICINNAVGCLDWNVGEWFPEETKTMETFLEGMKTCREEKKLPPPAKNQNMKELTPKMMESLKPVSKQAPQGSVLTSDSWAKVTKAANQPMEFLIHPRNLVKYQKIQQLSKRG